MPPPDASERSRALRHGLEALGRRVGRTPRVPELRKFLIEYEVQPAELEDLMSRAVLLAPRLVEAATPTPRRTDERRESQASRHIGRSETTRLSAAERVARRAIDDLINDWARAGEVLNYADVVRLVFKRQLSIEQAVAVILGLRENGIDVQVESDGDLADVDPRQEPGSGLTADAVGLYLKELHRHPLINADDERRLGRQIQLGKAADALLADDARIAAMSKRHRSVLIEIGRQGRLAHQDFVHANLRLVVSIAKKRCYGSARAEFADRIQDGNLGLLRAAEMFDPEQGLRFSTYATWWIRLSIARGSADRDRLVRLPVYFSDRLAKLAKARVRLAGRLDREPDLNALAVEIGCAVEEVQALLDWEANRKPRRAYR